MNDQERQSREEAFNIVRNGKKLTKAELKVVRALIKRVLDPDFESCLPPHRTVDEHGIVFEQDTDDDIEIVYRDCGRVYRFGEWQEDNTIALNLLPYAVPELPKYTTVIDKRPHIFQAIETLSNKALGWCQIYVIDKNDYEDEVARKAHKGIISYPRLEYENQMIAYLLDEGPEPSEVELKDKEHEEYKAQAWLSEHDRSDGWGEDF